MNQGPGAEGAGKESKLLRERVVGVAIRAGQQGGSKQRL